MDDHLDTPDNEAEPLMDLGYGGEHSVKGEEITTDRFIAKEV